METSRMDTQKHVTSYSDEESKQVNGSLSSVSSVASEEKVVLKKKVTLLRGISFITGTIIGAGIFITPKGVLENSGSVGMSLVVWAICGIFSLFGALCYAELGTCIKKSGGHYTYILEIFGPLLAFLRVWVELIVIRPAVMAVVSLAFGRYILEPFFIPCKAPESAIKLIALLMMMLLFYINSISVTWTARIQILLTAVKLVAMAIIIISGLMHLAKDSINLSDAFVGEVNIAKLPLALYAGMYAYAGWFYLNCVIEEVENPEKNVPIAICVSMTIVTISYLLMNVAYFAALTADELLASEAVAVTFAERLLGKFYVAIPVFVSLSCFGALNGGTFAVSRVFYAASREGHLPQILSMIHLQRHTPLPSVVCLFPLLVIMIYAGEINSLLNFLSFVRWFFIGLIVGGLIYLRYKYPEMPRPFKVPLFIPVLFCITCIFMVVLSLYSDPINTGIGFAITLTGIPAYYLFVIWDKKPQWFQNFMDYLTTTLQTILKVVPSDEQHTD